MLLSQHGDWHKLGGVRYSHSMEDGVSWGAYVTLTAWRLV